MIKTNFIPRGYVYKSKSSFIRHLLNYSPHFYTKNRKRIPNFHDFFGLFKFFEQFSNIFFGCLRLEHLDTLNYASFRIEVACFIFLKILTNSFFHFPGTFMLFKSTSAFKKQSVKPKKSGLDNPLDSFLGRNSILDDKYEDTVSQNFFCITSKGQQISKYETENIWNINFSKYKWMALSKTIV